MKTARSRTGDRRKTPVQQNSDSEHWEQQVDYPVSLEVGEGARADPLAGEPASREERIRLKAYYRAEQRSFDGGSQTEDWLEAEREVDGEDLSRTEGTRH